jgi:hypothetical protein
MPVQAGGVQIIVARDLTAGLAGRQPSVNLSTLDVLACTTFSCHVIHPYRLNAFTNKSVRTNETFNIPLAKSSPMKINPHSKEMLNSRNESGDGPNQARSELHDILCIPTQMMFWQRPNWQAQHPAESPTIRT